MRFSNSVYGVLMVGIVAATFSCGDDEDRKPNQGSSGKGGQTSGGTSNNGAGKNTGGKADEVGAGAGGENVGGGGEANHAGSPGGAAGEAGMGGAGGEAGQAPTGNCGNGHPDPGERCDDGNTASGDGCSSKCTVEACDACIATSFPPMAPFPNGDCNALTGDAKTKCEAVLACVATSGCALADKNLPARYLSSLPCFCGDLDYDTCSAFESTADLTGDCKDSIRAAANPPATGELTPALVLLQIQERTAQTAIAQSLSQVDYPGLLPSVGCDVLIKPAERSQCRQVLDCVLDNDCVVDDSAAACYCGGLDPDTCFSSSNPNDPLMTGKCKGVIQAAAGGATIIPLQIAQGYYDLSTPYGNAINTAVSLKTSCSDECYVSGAGGSGN